MQNDMISVNGKKIIMQDNGENRQNLELRIKLFYNTLKLVVINYFIIESPKSDHLEF